MMWLMMAQAIACVLVLIGLGFVLAVKKLGDLAWLVLDELQARVPAARGAARSARSDRDEGTPRSPALPAFAAGVIPPDRKT
jgi:hypothetical protein